jgi:hypothetical protein
MAVRTTTVSTVIPIARFRLERYLASFRSARSCLAVESRTSSFLSFDYELLSRASGACGQSKVATRALALTFTSSKSEVMFCDPIQNGVSIIALANAHEFDGERHVNFLLQRDVGLRGATSLPDILRILPG